MTTAATRPPRVLAVGAYERDNFGDLLFWLVTRPYLKDAEVHATAPFAAKMTELLDCDVEAYGPLLRDESFDVIWTVGGQVGKMDLGAAFRLSTPPAEYERYRALNARERAQHLRELVGGARIASPYIPGPLAYPRNAGAISVLNSAGLDGVADIEPNRRARVIALLRGTDLISVRDRASSDYLAELGIEHTLAPDAVHAISRIRPAERDPRSPVAIVQASAAHLDKYGHAELARALADSRQLDGLRIRFLLAGTAAGHDSVEAYEKVIGQLRAAVPDVDAEIITDRRPFDLVDHIRGARVVIATSLHARIVACSYGVPRVSLERPKPTKYARTWDPDMPFGVAFDGLDEAVAAALAAADKPEVSAKSEELSSMAHDNLESFARQALDLASTMTEAHRGQREQMRRRHHEVTEATRNELTARDERIKQLESELGQARTELATLRRSRSYRLATRVARVGRAMRRPLGRRSVRT